MTTALAVVVAGGTGERFGAPGGKQLIDIAGRPLFTWAVRACALSAGIDEIVLVAPEDRAAEYHAAAVEAAGSMRLATAVSGKTRQESVWAGLSIAAGRRFDTVVVHDGARPLATPALLELLLRALRDAPEADGVIVGHPSVDTVKVVEDGVVIDTPDRASLWAVQTPQVFRVEPLMRAYERAQREGFTGTDDASLVERDGGTVLVVAGPRDNIKITMPEDVAFAEAVLKQRGEGDA